MEVWPRVPGVLRKGGGRMAEVRLEGGGCGSGGRVVCEDGMGGECGGSVMEVWWECDVSVVGGWWEAGGRVL